jgi:IS4 transposase
MACFQPVPLGETLQKLFPHDFLIELAKATRAMVRMRKIGPVELFWTVVLGFGLGRQRSLSGLRRAFEKSTGTTVEESSFYDKFNAGFAKMLKQAAAHALDHGVGVGRALQGHLAGFRDIVLTDSTVVRLHDLLKKKYPGSRTNHSKAAVKAHWVMSVSGAGKHSVRLTPGRRHDGPVFQVGKWVESKLLMFDLGYFRYQLFDCIARNGGFFLSRLKANANPTIVSENILHRGQARSLVGQRIWDCIPWLQCETLDVMVQVNFNRRSYAGKSSTATTTFRVVGRRDPNSGEYHMYITNVAVEQLAAEQVQSTYALRWQIELLFKELKRHYHLEEMPSANPHVVEALLHAAIVTLVVSRTLLEVIRQQLGVSEERTPTQRWAAVLETLVADLLQIAIRQGRDIRELAARIGKVLLHEALDPNLTRMPLLSTIEQGKHSYRHRVRPPSRASNPRKAA